MSGNIVNVKFYNPTKDPVIINYSDEKWKYDSPSRLYGVNELIKYDGKQVIICNGELNRLMLMQQRFMAVCCTHGCGVFRPEWIEYFKNRDVVVIFNLDKESQSAANLIILKAFKKSQVSSIKNVIVPLPGDMKEVLGFFHLCWRTKEELQEIIDGTPAYEEPHDPAEEVPIRLASFTDIEKKEYVDRKVQCEITICGETDEAFHAVEEFKVIFCPKLKKGECFECVEPIKVPIGSQLFIGSCMSSDVQLTAMLRNFCCVFGQKCAIAIEKRTTIKEFFCHQRTNRIKQAAGKDGEGAELGYIMKQELVEKKCYYLSAEEIKPGDYLATGYVKSHPKTQQITMLIIELMKIDEDYETFDLSKNLTHLEAYRRLSWEEVVNDLKDHVTRIFERDEILTAVMLGYASPLWINFNGEIIRGWLTAVIIGDAGTGKSQTYSRLAEFMNIGDSLSGLTGSRTGLAYALVEHKQKGWQVKIGRYPANNGKILTIDETQFLNPNEIRTLSKAMEEGFLQIDRVKSKGYLSATRLIMICNPRKDKVMDSFTFGCEALKVLFATTVTRRIDIAVFANSSDIKNASFINKATAESAERKVTPEMLRALIYWSWNLKPAQILFTPEAEDLCLNKSNELVEKYGHAHDILLVPLSDFRKKLARISASFAVLSASADEGFSKLVISPEHVEKAAAYVDGIYSHENSGLDEYSDIQKANNELLDYPRIEKAFLERQENEKYDSQNEGIFERAIRILRKRDSIRREDLTEQVGCSIESTRKIIKFLKRFNLISSVPMEGYVKEPKFNKFLRRFKQGHPDFFEETGD